MKNWCSEKAQNILIFRTGKLDSNAAEPDGKYPFFTCAQETYKINNYAFDLECVLLAGNNAAGVFPLKYYKGKFNAYQRTYIIEPKDCSNLNTRYIYESFKLFLKSFEQTATGATTKFLTLGILNNLWISVPPLSIQRKIAAVLSAYDDLIENNNRRIAILEKMAEELYREWFVRLRFPGHEKVKIVKGVPEGWEINKFEDIITINPAVSIKKGDIADFIEMENVNPDKKYAYSVDQRVYHGGSSRFINGDTIFARITPCLQNGKIAKVNNSIDKGIGSTEFFVFRCLPNISTENFVYYLCRSNFVRETAINSMSGASGRQRADINSIKNILVLFPPFELLQIFEKNISKIDHKLQNLSYKNIILSNTRDRLLTRLMSGKIDLENLDIRFPQSMIEEEAGEPSEVSDNSQDQSSNADIRR